MISPLEAIWLTLLSLSMILSWVRIFRGPSIAERALAFDVLTSCCIGFFILAARIHKVSWALDAVLILCFLSFMGTLAVAYYMEDQKES